MKPMKEGWWYRRPDKATPLSEERRALARVAARCDAWNQFFEEHSRRLARIKGHFQWFNEHEYFTNSYMDVECSASVLRKTLAAMVLPGVVVPAPLRHELFDTRAWTLLPLSAFVRIPEKGAPTMRFGARRTPWEVPLNCFHLSHRIKHDWPGSSSVKRVAVLTFKHPQLDVRFNGEAWVAEHTFPKEATRQEMFDQMMAIAAEKLNPYLVTIEEETE